MFRRREGAEAVVVRDPAGEPWFRLGLFHRGLLPSVVAALEDDRPRTQRLSANGQVRELRLASAQTRQNH
jgi:hypothetical protein